MKASEVITKSRFILADKGETRWSDDRLISLLNEAILDIALTTRLYNSVGYLKIQKNVAVYDASNFLVKLNRVEYNDFTLAMSSFEEMDSMFSVGWQSKTGKTLRHVVYDLKKEGEFRLYPIPKEGASDFVESSSYYGIVTDLNYEDVELEVVGDYGDIRLPNLGEYLKLYYISSPKEIVSVDDELDSVIDKTTFGLLSNYIAGVSLRDNMEAQNRQVGNENLNIYEGQKQNIINKKMVGNVNRVRISEYRNMD